MSIRLEELREIELELTNSCNFACKLCFRHQVPRIGKIGATHQVQEPTFEQVKELLDKMPNLTDVTIAGQTGEPSKAKSLFRVVQYLNSRKIDITIYTNAEAQPLQYYTTLARLLTKRGRLCFGVFGSTQDKHAYYRPRSSLQHVLEVYDACCKHCRCEFWWILFEYNKQEYLDNPGAFGTRNVVVYNTLPFREFFEYSCPRDICFPLDLGLDVSKLDPTKPRCCPLDKTGQAIVDAELNVWHCFLEKYFKQKYCHLCNPMNVRYLEEHGCKGLNEFGG